MDYLTGLITVISMELIARRKWQGWLLGLCNQALWITLCYQRQIWGLLIVPVILVWRYSVALYKWRELARVKAPA